MRRKFLLSLIFMICLCGFILITPSHATVDYVELGLKSNKTVVMPGDVITLTISIEKIQTESGIEHAYIAMNYDSNVFEVVEDGIKGLNKLKLSSPYNENNKKIVLSNVPGNSAKDIMDMVTVSLKVKSVANIGNHMIKLSGSNMANTDELFIVDEEKAEVEIQVKNISVTEESGYVIKDDEIKGILPDTTIEELKENIKTNGETITVEDVNGNVVPAGTKMATGMVVKTSDESYAVVVKGDLNGDGLVDISDIAALKMHVVGLRYLTAPYLDASDLDDDGKTSSARDLSILVNYDVGLCEIDGSKITVD